MRTSPLAAIPAISALLAALALAGPASAAAPRAVGSAAPEADDGTDPGLVGTSLRYAFYARAGLSLHHFLYQWARNEGRLPGDRGPVPEMPERERRDALSAAEREALGAAVAVYRRDALPRDLLFDPEMAAVGHSLAGGEDPLDCGEGELAAELEPALRLAWPVYERHWWPEHRRRSREWVEALGPDLERYEKDATAALARAWGVEWPRDRVRVDVTAYANWAGAYTTGDPARINLATSNRDLAGIGGLEALLHEVSHIDLFERANDRALAAAFEAAGTPVPRGLWHVMIFYLAGDIVGRLLAADGRPGYEPYGESTGLYDRVPGWRDHARALERHWRPFLDGTADRATALGELAASYGAAPPATDRRRR